jgi:ubiquinone/menaquinone biosynthesis C-methylase UbiE
MNTQQAYNLWATQYDTNDNKTRDLEGHALRNRLENFHFSSCLEIGCGTGKNTDWLITKVKQIVSVDFSEEMLKAAKEKITSDHVQFIHADIRSGWNFRNKLFDLVTFSLVLEHVDDLNHIFSEASLSLVEGGHVYIGELHPCKQYSGSKARFETDTGTQEAECFTHHVSDFVQAAKRNGLLLIDINEYFDNNDRNEMPRILTIVLKKT